jgi:hypothetical protein
MMTSDGYNEDHSQLNHSFQVPLKVLVPLGWCLGLLSRTNTEEKIDDDKKDDDKDDDKNGDKQGRRQE